MNIAPALDEVLAFRGSETHIALSLELWADEETPISLYRKLAEDSDFAFLLESAEGGETVGRYSFIGIHPVATVECRDASGVIRRGADTETHRFADPLLLLQSVLTKYRVVPRPDLPRFQGGLVGFLGYDCVRYFESVSIPKNEPDAPKLPDVFFMLAEQLLIVDHLHHRLIFVAHMPLGGDRTSAYREVERTFEAWLERLRRPAAYEIRPRPATSPLPEVIAASLSPAQFKASVERAKADIVAGEVFQVVVSRGQTMTNDAPALELYRALRALNPSPYMFLIKRGQEAVVGASPEVMVRLDQGEVLLRPIAGTRPRGKNREEDELLEEELLHDEKELAEHRMLLDLGRNDVGRVCRPGSVKVLRPLHIERYSHVMHIVSDVVGEIDDDKTAFDVFRACFPAGTVSGAPKIRAMEIIAELEPVRRQLYAGAVGYFDFGGNMDTCIAIRTMTLSPGQVHVQSGGGIVFDSNPDKEFEESVNKARACMAAVRAVNPVHGGGES
jgi:anthranilate synthase component I